VRKLLFVIVASLFISTVSQAAAVDVAPQTIVTVYQLDTPAHFDFEVNRDNGCGSNLYRVVSPNEYVAGRKLSLVLTAFTAGKKIAFHSLGTCTGNRVKVTWVRMYN